MTDRSGFDGAEAQLELRAKLEKDAARQSRRRRLLREPYTLADRVRIRALRAAKSPGEDLERVLVELRDERLRALNSVAKPTRPGGRIRLRAGPTAMRTSSHAKGLFCCRCCEPEDETSDRPETVAPTGNFPLMPLDLGLHEVTLPMPGNNTIESCSQGMIGLLDSCTGVGIFVNGNDGQKEAYVEQRFRGTAPHTGVATLEVPQVCFTRFNYSMTGNLLGQAGDQRPDADLELTVEVDIEVGNEIVRLTTSDLLDVETYGLAMAGEVATYVHLPGDATLDLDAGDRVDFTMRLRVSSWSSSWGTAIVFVTALYLPANTDQQVRVYY